MIGVGIAGAGHFAAMHAQALRAVPGFRVVAAAAGDLAAATAFTGTYGGRPYTDWRVLLDDPAVEVVLITLPHHLHAPAAIAAAQAGKHVLVEKPMALTLAECRAMAAAAAQADTQLLVGQLMRFVRPCQTARAYLASGALGPVRYGRSVMTKLWMEGNRRPWHLQPETGGGMLMTVGIHALDRLVWLMGRDVVAVAAMSGHGFHQQAVADIDLLLLRFAEGGLGEVASVGYRDTTMVNVTEIVCEGGSLRLDLSGRVQILRDGIAQDLAGACEPDWMLRGVEREWQALAAMITGGPPPVTPAAAGHLIACIEAAQQAARLRREVAVQAWG